MESVLVSIVSVALVIITVVTMSTSLMQSANTISESWKDLLARSEIVMRTQLNPTPPSGYSGGIIDLEIDNQGQTALAEFSSWDVIAEYPNGEARYIDYVTGYPPSGNQWTVEGIYMSGNVTEVFDPDILNPGEYLRLAIVLSPEIGTNSTARLTVTTPNGIAVQSMVHRE